jgi:endonuclease/exonuclease/phosphatase family metal-dependent hydrolase
MRFVWILLAYTSLLGSVENSITPLLEKYELIENLPEKKFTQSQFQEIKEALSHKQERIRIMSYNMLFNLYDHNLAEINRWEQRLPRLVELIRETNPDIINTQELWPEQLADLEAQLKDEYSVVAYPNDETYAIFYKRNRFELVASEPSDPIVTATLKDMITDKVLAVFNTHLAFSNKEKREKEARDLLQKTADLSCATLVTGDLNTFPARLENEKFPFYDGDYILRLLTSKNLKNAKDLSLIGHFGPISTFTNDPSDILPFQGTGTPGVFLDHVLVSPEIQVLTHAVQPGTVDGHFPSDHLPVIVDFLVN